MCGRYTARDTWRELVELYRLTNDVEAMDLSPRFNMSPGTDLPVIRVRDDRREVVRMRWGFRTAIAVRRAGAGRKNPMFGKKWTGWWASSS